MTLPRLLLTRRLPDAVETHLSSVFEVERNEEDRPLGRDALRAAMQQFDAICPTITDRIDTELFETAGRRVRILANFGAGVEHIDLGAAQRSGVLVTNTPDALTDSTADIAMLLILMAARRAGEGERELRAGHWAGWRPTHLLGRSVTGKTLGLLGFGRIAQATAQRARAFGMNIAYHSRTRLTDAEQALGATYLPSPAALAAASDVLSLHVPGGAATHHLVDKPFLAQLKPGAILINTARGSIIDEPALAKALHSGTVAAAGLDVFEREPEVHADLLLAENVVLLPHLGSATIETRTAMGMQAAANLEAFFAGRDLPNRVA